MWCKMWDAVRRLINKWLYFSSLIQYTGGEEGIRTLGTLARTTVFETAPFDRSGTSPPPCLGQSSPARNHRVPRLTRPIHRPSATLGPAMRCFRSAMH